ncbi:unnamed protein product [Paramecium primaurelia]|uniref:Clu domain-containing protein n=4 Tax=Paramecium TaxID=5884 RepID=A0A8S1N2Z6_PARPR|nr:unnamed protein product [Paramecium primaurelia]
MNQIGIVDKLDDSFKKFNSRILEVDQGRIKYYSKPPPDFQSENPKLNDKPKAGILFSSIVDIIEADPRISNDLQPRVIAFTFYSNQLLKGNELNKPEPTLPKPKPPLQTWIFLFRDIESRERWCEIFAMNLQRQEAPTASVKQFVENQLKQLEKLSPDQIKEQNPIESVDEEEKLKNEAKVRSGKVKQFRTNLKLQEIDRKNKEEEINRQRKQQFEEEQKRVNLQREEEEKKRREEEQRNLRREQERQMKLRISTAWEFRYYQALEDCIESCDNFDNSMKAGLRLIKYLETFKEQAFITVKQLICELLDKKITVVNQNQSVNLIEEDNLKKTIFSKPKKKQQNNEENNYVGQFQDCFYGTFQFKSNNMLIYIATSETVERTLLIPNKSVMIQSLNLNLLELPFWYGIVHSNCKKRQLSDEFKALNYLNDICFSQRSVNKYFKLKVPLSCQIEYLGFKALVLACPPSPLDDSSLIYGVPNGESYYKASQKLELEIEALGRSLAIKPHCFMWKIERFDPKKIQLDTKRSVIQLSVNTQIHSGNIAEFEQLKAQIKIYADQESEQEVKRQGLFYLLKVKEILPYIIEEHYSELVEQSNKTIPANHNFDHLLQNYEFRRARPEFLSVYYDTGVSGQLRAQQSNIQNRKVYNPDAYDTIEESNDISIDQMALAEMSKNFIRGYIQEFVNKIDQLEICPIDSYTLRESFRLFGINMRFLNLVALQTKIPHVQQLCEVEMMARSIKNIFNQQFTEFLQTITEDQIPYKPFDPKKIIREPFSDQEEMETKRNFPKKQSIMLPRTIIQERETMSDFIEMQYKEQLADLLNLLFSKSNIFYEQILFKQVLFDFNYDLNLKLKGICSGSLLSALQYNLKFESKFEPKDIIFGTPYAQVDESVINKFNLKQYLHQKTYQQLYKTSMIPASSQMTPLTTPPTKGAHSIKQINKQVFFDASSITQLRFDVQSFSMLEVEICKLVNKFNIFKLQQNYQLAIKVLHIRLNLLEGLEHSSNIAQAKTIVLTDLAELHFKQKQYQQTMVRLAEALKYLNPNIYLDSENLLNQLSNMNQRWIPKVGMIRPLMLLLEIVTELYQDYVFIVFDLLIFNLEFCLGSQHHYYAKVFNIMGTFFKNRGQIEDMLQMNTMQIICLIKTIGHQHQLTADAYIEIGEQKQSPEQQILFYEKAFYIFETLYTDNSLQTAYVACKLTKGYTDCGKINEALKISQLACKILKTKAQDNLAYLLELSYYRAYNFYKNSQKEQARKECEEYFNVLQLYWDQIQAYDQQDQSHSDIINNNKDLQSFPIQLIEMTRKTLITFVEIFLAEASKEHRNFLYQMFDLIIENHARSNLLEQFDSQFNVQFIHVLKKIKTLGSLQAYFEWSLIQFVDKTGGDTNWLTFNFKVQNYEQLKEPYENYECIVVTIGRKILSQIFEKIMINNP